MYTLENWYGIDKYQFVEGMREDWVSRIVGNYQLLKNKKAKCAYLNALYVLHNEFLPIGYLRSEPIARFETYLTIAIRQIEDLQS